MENSVYTRFEDLLTNDKKDEIIYSSPRGDERLVLCDGAYFIIAATLRGYVHLFNRIPYGFVGSVYIPEEFRDTCPARRNYDVVSTQNGVCKAAVSPFVPARYDFASLEGKKNPIFAELKKMDSLSYRKENALFVIEEERLIKRAVDDGTDVKYIVYSPKSRLLENGTIESAKQRRIQCFMATEGIISSVTQTRPVPKELAVCAMPQFMPENISIDHKGVILIADNVENPDNLGLVIRTADACGADAVINIGNTSVYNKNCIRAARGAVGRFPILEYPVNEIGALTAKLKALGYKIYGTSARTEITVDNMDTVGGRAFSVSNETNGISKGMEDAADEMVRIPMATGQSSFNVAVAAGIILAKAIVF